MSSPLAPEYILRYFNQPAQGEPLVISMLADLCSDEVFLSDTSLISVGDDGILYLQGNDLKLYTSTIDITIASTAGIQSISYKHGVIAYTTSTTIYHSTDNGDSWTSTSVVQANKKITSSATEIYFSVGAQLRRLTISSGAITTITTLDSDIITLDLKSSVVLIGTSAQLAFLNTTTNTVYDTISRNQGGITIANEILLSDQVVSFHNNTPSKYYRFMWHSSGSIVSSPGFYNGVYFTSSDPVYDYRNTAINGIYPFPAKPDSDIDTIINESLTNTTVYHPADDYANYTGDFAYWLGYNAIYSVDANEFTLVHLLNTTALTSPAIVISNSALGQRQVLSPDNLTSPVIIVSDFSLTQRHSLSTTALTSPAIVVDSTSLGQSQQLTANNIVLSAGVVSSSTIAQVHNIKTPEVYINPIHVSSVNISGEAVFDIADIDIRYVRIDEFSLNQQHDLNLNSIVSEAVEFPSLNFSTYNDFIAENLTLGIPEISNTDLVTSTGVQISDIVLEGVSVSTSEISQEHSLITDDIDFAWDISALILVQHNLLSTNDITSLPVEVPSVNFFTYNDFIAENLTLGIPEINDISIQQFTEILIDDIDLPAAQISESILEQHHFLNALNIESPRIGIEEFDVIQTSKFNIDPILIIPEIDSTSIDQVHIIAIDDIEVGPIEISTPDLFLVFEVEPDNLEISAVEISDSDITQLQVFQPNSVDLASIIVDNLTLLQDHILEPNNLEISAVEISDPDSAITHVLSTGDIELSPIIIEDFKFFTGHVVTKPTQQTFIARQVPDNPIIQVGKRNLTVIKVA